MTYTIPEVEQEYDSDEKAREAAEVDKVILDYINKYGCGDTNEGCDTCPVGVAVGLKFLDAAFNLGVKTGRENP